MIRFVILFCAFAVTACAHMEKSDALVTDHVWRLAWLKGWGVAEHSGLEGTEAAYLRFNDDGRVEGSGGCNRIAGEYRQMGGQIEFSPLISTRRACIAGMEREGAFLKSLEDVSVWQKKGNRLRLYDTSGRLLMEMRAVNEK